MEQQNNDVPATDFGNIEPVAWYLPSPEGDDSIFRDHRTVVACTGSKWEGFLPLYVAPPKDSTNHVAEPIGWLEAPHGTFRRNHSVSVTFPPQTVDWSIPVFLGAPPETCGLDGTDPEAQRLRKINATLLEALNIIAGNRPCVDNLMGDADIARAAIARATEEGT